jgi:large subunit ribosomal protein L1
MDQKTVLQVLKEIKNSGTKRNFVQSYDFIINLKNLDLKKPEQQLDFVASLHNETGKKRKVGAFVGPELMQQAQQVCDKAIGIEQFSQYQDKKSIRKMAKEIDFFLAQATIMPKVALQFGKILGPRGKMPNPKLGCVVPPSANLKILYEKLQKTVVIKVKTQPVIQAMVGTESMPDEEVADNIMSVYNAAVQQLPSEKNNIRSIYLKTTMGSPMRLDAERVVKSDKPAKKRILAQPVQAPQHASLEPSKPSEADEKPAEEKPEDEAAVEQKTGKELPSKEKKPKGPKRERKS